MKKTSLRSATLALALAAIVGFSGTALARGPMYGHPGMNMTPEQYSAMQETYAEFDKTILPLRQQMFAKQSELQALYYNGTPESDPKVQALIKDINDLDAKLYAANGELRARMSEKGIPFGPGMRHGYGHGGMMRGHGYGYGCCAW